MAAVSVHACVGPSRIGARMRGVAKWGGVVVCVAAAAVFAVSLRWSVCATRWPGKRGEAGVYRFELLPGAVRLTRYSTVDEPTLQQWQWEAVRTGRAKWVWKPKVVVDSYEVMVFVPMWIPFSLGAVNTMVVAGRWLRASSRRRVGRCARCGYDLAGLAAGAVCPECGLTSIG